MFWTFWYNCLCFWICLCPSLKPGICLPLQLLCRKLHVSLLLLLLFSCFMQQFWFISYLSHSFHSVLFLSFFSLCFFLKSCISFLKDIMLHFSHMAKLPVERLFFYTYINNSLFILTPFFNFFLFQFLLIYLFCNLSILFIILNNLQHRHIRSLELLRKWV